MWKLEERFFVIARSLTESTSSYNMLIPLISCLVTTYCQPIFWSTTTRKICNINAQTPDESLDHYTRLLALVKHRHGRVVVIAVSKAVKPKFGSESNQSIVMYSCLLSAYYSLVRWVSQWLLLLLFLLFFLFLLLLLLVVVVVVVVVEQSTSSSWCWFVCLLFYDFCVFCSHFFGLPFSPQVSNMKIHYPSLPV